MEELWVEHDFKWRSTFGGNALASRVGIEALKVIRDGKLMERAEKSCDIFKQTLHEIQTKHKDVVSEMCGMGLPLAIVIDPNKLNGKTAWDL